MPYILDKPEQYVHKSFKNEAGETQCVEFLRQTLALPHTSLWVEGRKITQGDRTVIKGTAIATFVSGRYPQTGSTGKHAAIYLDQDGIGIIVLDQWKKQGEVLKRTIPFKPKREGLSNDGTAFSNIETASASAVT